MTFLNATLLIALSSAAIPIVLHLLAKKEPKQVVFPSVRLLTQRLETNRSKMRVRRWWLLAIRAALLAVLALALARPALAGAFSLTWMTIAILGGLAVALIAMASVAAVKQQSRTTIWSLTSVAAVALLAAGIWSIVTLSRSQPPEIDVRDPIALAIVVDNGPLSAWQSPQFDHLSRMRECAKQLIEAAGPESRVALIDRSFSPAAFSMDNAGAVSKINQLAALQSCQGLESSIEKAAQLLSSSEIPSRQLVVLTSLPKSSFTRGIDDANALSIETEKPITLTLWDIGAFEGMNRSLSAVKLSEQSPSPGVAISVATSVTLQHNAAGENPGAAIEEPIEVAAECVLFPRDPSLPVIRDGQMIRPQAQPVDRISFDLSVGRETEIRMTLPPLEMGLHHAAIRLVGSDALQADDDRFFTISVLPPSRLLLVADQVDEGEEIAYTITSPLAIDDPASQYAIERIGANDIAAANIDDFDAVVMLDPPKSILGEAEVERYLAGSGNLLVAVGRHFSAADASRSFPEFARPWRVPDPGSFLEITSPSHPALADLASTIGGVPFADFRVQQYWQVRPREGDQVLMRFAGTGHPALVEAKSGDGSDGRVLILMTPVPELADPTGAWNELFSDDEFWPAFALVRDLVRYVSRRTTDNWTVAVGTPVSIPLPRTQGTGDSVGGRLQWFPAAGDNPVPIEIPELDESTEAVARRVVVGRPSHQGVHWIRGASPGLGFTVNLPRESLASERLQESERDALFGKDAYRRIDSIDQMDWTTDSESKVVRLWSPLMLLALACFLLELVLGNRFYGGASQRTAASKQPRHAA